MFKRFVVAARMLLASCVVMSCAVSTVAAQTPQGSTSAPARLGQIDETQTTPLQGHVRADLTAQRDLGLTEDAKPMQLWLLLGRTPEQQADLDSLLAQQQQPGSPMYHKWLTPAQFGERFGAAQADVAKLTNWLQSHGFAVQGLLNNGSVLQFTATAGQVRAAFKTEIHYWNVQGGQYAANAQDPLIPTSISSLVVGIQGLNRIPKKPHHTTPGQAAYDAQAHTWSSVTANSNVPARPNFNAGGGNFYVTPQDFYTIYDVNHVFTGGNIGAGATVAVVEQSDMQYGTVNGSGQATGGDVATFRSLFGVGGTLNMKVMHGAGSVPCNAPGILNGDEGEATLDAEWANALAPSAQLIYMACDFTVHNGVISSLAALIDNNIGNVLSMSYGSSEFGAVSSDYTMQDTLFQQAAAQGQTVIVSAGDSGSDTADQNTSGTATSGLNIDIFSASPLVLSAGGTDFSDTYDALEGGPAQSTYWAASNTSKYGDALGYIPETPWNDSCASSILAHYEGSNPAAYCGQGPGTDPFILGDVVAGGGGFSTHYSQPSWQTGVLGVTGSTRAVPDISMFAANGLWGHALVFCDSSSSSSNCSSTSTFGLAGGTSFVAPALAGVTGLLVTATGEGQGVLNPALYALARAQFSGSLATSCYSNGQTNNIGVTTSLPAAACIFHDVTSSNNDVPCASGSLSCFVNSGKSYGLLSTTGAGSLTVGYPSGVGYDEATGLGSVDVYNLITKWNQAFTSSTALMAASSSIPASGSDQLTATVTGGLPTGSGSGAPAVHGSVSFAAGSTGLGNCTLSGNSCAITVQGSALAAGANSITATYAGNGTYPASTSTPVTVTVTGGATALTLSTTSLAFGSQPDGKASNAMSVTVSNPTGAAVTISGISFTGTNPSDFSQTNTCPASIASGANCSISAKFTPGAPGARSATLNVANGGSISPLTVSLSGTGVAPPVNPVLSPGTGTYLSGQQVTITDGTSGALIYYNINGGSYIKYTGPITVTATETITGVAAIVAGNGYAQSALITNTYTILPPPAVPVISPLGGSYTTVQTVSISDTTGGASIFYSINGGAYAPYGGSFSLFKSETISAYATVTSGGTTATSATNTQTYSVLLTPATPVFLLAPGTYTGTQSLGITESTPGAIIGYSINGSAFAQYTAPLTLTSPGTYTVKAVGYYTNGTQSKTSSVLTGVYTIH